MNLLIQHIEYLISRNDCVIIPRLGALLSQYCPARIDAQTGTVYPPSRKFTFNSGLRDNDATLALSISKAKGIPCQRAIDLVNKEVDSMLHQLHSFGHLSLGRAGTLNYNAADGACEFEPFSSDRLSVATSWLPTVSAVLHTTHHADDSYASSGGTRRPVWSKVTRIAAVIAVLISVWFVASTPVSIDNKSVLTASLAPDISNAKTPAILTAAQRALNGESPTEKVAEATGAEDLIATPSSSEEIGDMAPGKFYIIVGATVSSREAKKFIDLHPDIQEEAFIVKYGKKHVISVSVHDTREDATSACVEIRKTYPTAWIGTN